MNALQGRWEDASYLRPPTARCGHIAVSIDKLNDYGTELIVIHGGINENKEALSDLCVLQVAHEQWIDVEPSALGPAARAFHAATVINNTIFIFAGHVYIPQQKKLHQFNDLWSLDTDTWQWHRMEASVDAPMPPHRDRASLVALDLHRLLMYGGADASNKRFDDTWVYNLKTCSWKEIKTFQTIPSSVPVVAASSKPRSRCSATLFSVGNRVLLFGGDCGGSVGPNNELWSLRGGGTGIGSGGVESESSGVMQWTELSLTGAVPSARRGHAAAPIISASSPLANAIVFVGGLSEQKSMLGMKKQTELLIDVVVLQLQQGALSWRRVETTSSGAGSGRPFPREKHTLVALRDGRLFLFGGTDGSTTLGDAWWLTLEDIAPSPSPPPARPPSSPLSFSEQQKQKSMSPQPSLLDHAPGIEGDATITTATPPPPPSSSYWAALPSSLQSVVPQLATSALTSLRGRLGYPSTPAGDAAAAAAAGAAAGAPAVVDALQDQELIALGRTALGVDSTPDELVRAARDYFSQTHPHELKLGVLPVVMRDYKRLARAGWAAAIAEYGPEALVRDDVVLMGRYLTWNVDDVRLRDVGDILEEYRRLVAMAVAVAGEREEREGGGAEEDAVSSELPPPPPPPNSSLPAAAGEEGFGDQEQRELF